VKKRLLIFAGIVIVLVISAIVGFNIINGKLNSLSAITFETIDLSEIDDGVYEGSYSQFPISVVVEVTILNGSITDIIIIKHQSGQGQPAEVIIDDVIASQTLEVDTIAGATYSSIVILLAIEDALNGD
jgi:uncharacterized protein with FMN-binding domain